MREFDETWSAQKGETRIDLTPRHMVDVWVSCAQKVQVLGVPEEAEKAAVVLKSGEEFRFRAPLYGFRELIVKGPEKVEYGLRLVHSPRQNGEVISDEKPPVLTLPEPSNLVLQMRRLTEQHHARNRMPVLEPEDGPGFMRYEFEDEDEVLFEEEAYTKAVKEAKEAKKKEAEEKEKAEAEAKGRKEPEAKAAHAPPEKAGEAGAAPPGPPPAEGRHAAE